MRVRFSFDLRKHFSKTYVRIARLDLILRGCANKKWQSHMMTNAFLRLLRSASALFTLSRANFIERLMSFIVHPLSLIVLLCEILKIIHIY